MQKSSSGYSDAEFVSIYDACIGESFLERIFPILDRLVLQHIPQRARVLDLCCGTGNLAFRLFNRGYEVVGIDNSGAMLERARQKLPQATFIEEDARRDFSTATLSSGFLHLQRPCALYDDERFTRSFFRRPFLYRSRRFLPVRPEYGAGVPRALAWQLWLHLQRDRMADRAPLRSPQPYCPQSHHSEPSRASVRTRGGAALL